ncbi:MoxR family ATPase [Infirmifilum lucidum]|uniref:MoxR family ATPase n=1 Tax=Infirmifilum lucidum TaxID=2776706 RepID=A0A7L9FHL3_9CREN|nr:MoxR family ATPase [Infirmifilum lucidum]QOJ79290.1 MoxR family ATPase [Infirmifilum lucidum]
MEYKVGALREESVGNSAFTAEAKAFLVRASEILNKLDSYIVGYDDLKKLLLVAALTGGHIFIEGPPGTGKTSVARVFASLIGGSFKRVQMTPDLLPSDIIGTYYFDLKRGEWVLRKGPIFTNVLFIDELNRAPPRTQSALLQAMQEREVSIEGVRHALPKPFLVLASQMPVGSEGTYPLTPVLVDRFAYGYQTSYPDEGLEATIIDISDAVESVLEVPSGEAPSKLRPVISQEELLRASELMKTVYVSEKITRYIVSLVGFIRRSSEVLLGPSPRASIWLYRGARALAFLEGRGFVVPDDVKSVARYVLAHRIVLKPESQSEGVSPLDVVERALKSVEVPKV